MCRQTVGIADCHSQVERLRASNLSEKWYAKFHDWMEILVPDVDCGTTLLAFVMRITTALGIESKRNSGNSRNTNTAPSTVPYRQYYLYNTSSTKYGCIHVNC
jgi:hypothetical protein